MTKKQLNTLITNIISEQLKEAKTIPTDYNYVSHSEHKLAIKTIQSSTKTASEKKDAVKLLKYKFGYTAKDIRKLQESKKSSDESFGIILEPNKKNIIAQPDGSITVYLKGRADMKSITSLLKKNDIDYDYELF